MALLDVIAMMIVAEVLFWMTVATVWVVIRFMHTTTSWMNVVYVAMRPLVLGPMSRAGMEVWSVMQVIVLLIRVLAHLER
jgi:hypothetical protein